MKKLLPALLILAVFITACGKIYDPTPVDPNANNKTLIIGKWKDGVASSVYFVAGKEVYREAYPAPTTVTSYYEFKSNGTFVLDTLQASGAFVPAISINYTLSNSNTTLHLSSPAGSSDANISFTDNNTLIISSTTTGGVSYYKAGALYNADSVTDYSTLVRF